MLDALEPARDRAVSRGTIDKLGIKPGDMVRVATRRGTVELYSRQDDAMPDGVVFIPFAFVEAAANLLTNPKLDPFGKIPEFKFCAARWRRSARSARRRSKSACHRRAFPAIPAWQSEVVANELGWPGQARP